MDYTSLIINGAIYDLHRTHSVITLTQKRRAKVKKLILSKKFELNLFAGSRNDLENMHIICI